MPEQSRQYSLKGEIFANDAATIRPASPITGSSYRNPNLTTITVTNGWLYNTIVDSYEFNEVMHRITGVLKEVEEQGVLYWSDQINYSPGSIVRLQDQEEFYYCRLENGPGTAAGIRYPTNNNLAYWKPLAMGGGGAPDTGSIAELRAEVANALAIAENALAKANKGCRKLFDIFYAFTWQVPDGAVRLNGQEISSASYPEFYNAATTSPYKTRIPLASSLSDWNAVSSGNGGNCPLFFINSSTKTIKLPCMTQILQPTTANNITMTPAALPNIKGTIWGEKTTMRVWEEVTGAFYAKGSGNNHYGNDGVDTDNTAIGFAASEYNKIYKDGATVQPPTNRMVLFIQIETKPTNTTQFGDIEVVTPSVVSSIIISGGISVLGDYNYFGHLMVSGAEVATQDWVLNQIEDIVVSGGVAYQSWVRSNFVSSSVQVFSGGSIGYIPILSGGMCYRFADPLTTLSIGAITSSMQESDILFTAGGVEMQSLKLQYIEGQWTEWDEDLQEDVTRYAYHDIVLSEQDDNYIYAPISHSLYEISEDGGHSAYLSAGSFTCSSAGGQWVVSAHNVLQICDDGGSVSTRTINGLIASGSDLETWTIDNTVTIRFCFWDSVDLILQDNNQPADNISTSSAIIPCDVVLPSGALLVNSSSIMVESGHHYEMNVKHGAIVMGEWMEAQNE